MRCKGLLTHVGLAGGVPIGDGEPGDLQALVELDRLCFEARAWPARAWWEVLREPGWTVRTVRGAGTVIGASVLWAARPVSSLASIAVSPSWRQQGLGMALLDDAVAQARLWGVRWLALNVDCSHTWARYLYRRRGFGLARRFREDGVARLEMLKRLRVSSHRGALAGNAG